MQKLSQFMLSAIRVIVLGIEDGIVSSLGVVTGIAEGTEDRLVIILSGVIVALVEALSMTAGIYLSDKSAKEAHVFVEEREAVPQKRREIHDLDRTNPVKDAILMYLANTAGGAIPVLPYVILPVKIALPISVVVAVTVLFVVGAQKGKLTGTNALRSGLEMAVISITAASLGFVIGNIASIMFPSIKIR